MRHVSASVVLKNSIKNNKMNQEKIDQLVALFATGDPSFLDLFRAERANFSIEETWQVIRRVSKELNQSLDRMEANFHFAKAA